jgi:hypothetical protein
MSESLDSWGNTDQQGIWEIWKVMTEQYKFTIFKHNEYALDFLHVSWYIRFNLSVSVLIGAISLLLKIPTSFRRKYRVSAAVFLMIRRIYTLYLVGTFCAFKMIYSMLFSKRLMFTEWLYEASLHFTIRSICTGAQNIDFVDIMLSGVKFNLPYS